MVGQIFITLHAVRETSTIKGCVDESKGESDFVQKGCYELVNLTYYVFFDLMDIVGQRWGLINPTRVCYALMLSDSPS